MSFEGGYLEKTLLAMLRYFLSLNADKITKKQRLKILDSFFPSSAEIRVSYMSSIKSYSSIEETQKRKG